MKLVEDKLCSACGTMLHKHEFIDLSVDERRFDYLDSPNKEEHTHDRCRWYDTHAKLVAVADKLQVERAKVATLREACELAKRNMMALGFNSEGLGAKVIASIDAVLAATAGDS